MWWRDATPQIRPLSINWSRTTMTSMTPGRVSSSKTCQFWRAPMPARSPVTKGRLTSTTWSGPRYAQPAAPRPAGSDASAVSAALIHARPSDLARAVANVLENALRHAQTCVAVSLTERDGHLELAVRDDGRGGPPGRSRTDLRTVHPARRGPIDPRWRRRTRYRQRPRHCEDDRPGARFVMRLPLPPTT